MDNRKQMVAELRSMIASLNRVIGMLGDSGDARSKTATIHTGKNLSVPDAAVYMGVSQRTIRKIISERQIVHTKIGRRVLIPLSSIEEFLAQRAVPVFDAKAFAKEILEGGSSGRMRKARKT